MDEDDEVPDGVSGIEGGTPYRAVKRFEDLIAWQRAREVTAEIYRITQGPTMQRDFGLRGQMQRAAVSMMTNIAEGYERGAAQEYHHFLTISKGSCAELRSLLYVALDAGYISPVQFEEQLTQSERSGQIIGALRAAISRRLDAQTLRM